VLRCLPPFFDGVLHGVLSNTRMPSNVEVLKKGTWASVRSVWKGEVI